MSDTSEQGWPAEGEQPEETVNPAQEGHESVTEESEQYPSADELGDEDAGPTADDVGLAVDEQDAANGAL